MKKFIAEVCGLLSCGEYPLNNGYPIKEIKQCFLDGKTVEEAYDFIVWGIEKK